MVVVLSTMVTLVSLLACAELEGRERRMRAGAPAWADLARITGVADHRRLARMPGVSLTGDGTLRFDPAARAALPVHVTGSLLEHRFGHGASLSLGIAALGIGLRGTSLPEALWLLLACAAGYQLLARLYAFVVWIEGRTAD
jgi:hypothetical protein